VQILRGRVALEARVGGPFDACHRGLSLPGTKFSDSQKLKFLALQADRTKCPEYRTFRK
jgi:hypothetical protein